MAISTNVDEGKERRPPRHNAGELRVRRMQREDVELAIAWAAREGWNPGFDDADAFFATDPNGFFIGEVDGEPVSTIACVNYGNEFAFIGLYIVHPDHRGRGYGLETWQAALAHAGERNVGLDGVVEQQDCYKRSGFGLAYRNVRFELGEDALAGLPEEMHGAIDVVELQSLPLTQIEAMDRRVFPADRSSFLRHWIAPRHGVGLGLVEDGELLAMGVIRQCKHGYKVGPLTAKSDLHAEQLLRALCHRADYGPIYLDVPEPNFAAMKLAERWGMRPVFETARMYKRVAPGLALHEIFGVTTLELG